MKRRHAIIVLVCLAVIVGLCLWIGTGYPGLLQRRHLEALAAWPRLVADQFKGDIDTVHTTFKRCFREGDPASKYEHLLSTAKKEIFSLRDGTDQVIYRWLWRQESHIEGGGFLEVHVVNGKIERAFFNEFIH